jgi:hypothetical protein
MPLTSLRNTLTTLLFLSLALAGCGGGKETSANNRAPVYAATLSQAAPVLADYNDVVQQVYVGYFGRPADAGGLAYFEAQFLAAKAPTTLAGVSQAYTSNADVKALVDSFSSSAESAALYPGDNNTFILAIYQNLFNRVADDAGKAYWADLINRGLITRGAAAISIMSGARASDAAIISNKTQVASSFTTALDTDEKRVAYSGLVANVSVRAMLGTVTDTTSLTSFQATLSATLSKLVLTPASNSCIASNFTVAKFNAIALGMTSNQVGHTIGCALDDSHTMRTADFVSYSWTSSSNGQDNLITVYFDAAGSLVKGIGGGSTFKISGGALSAPPISSVTATCTAANFTLANYNAIALGMTPDQVSQAIACANDGNHTMRTADFVSYTWRSALNGEMNLITVYFDATGSRVTGIGGGPIFKIAGGNVSAPISSVTASCTAANFTLANYNAIAPGMTPNQVSQAIGCALDDSRTIRTADFVSYSWTSSSNGQLSLITVYFDATGSAVKGIGGGSTFKMSGGALSAPPISSVTATCTPANFTLASYNAIALGMTANQVSQTLACANDDTHTIRTADFVSYSWTSASNGQVYLITVYFDAAGSIVRGIGDGSTFKISGGALSAPPISSVTATCTAANFTLANYNAIALGMTADRVSQTIGCINDDAHTIRTADFVSYTWTSVSNGKIYVISVYFDGTGSVVTGIGGGSTFKISGGF